MFKFGKKTREEFLGPVEHQLYKREENDDSVEPGNKVAGVDTPETIKKYKDFLADAAEEKELEEMKNLYSGGEIEKGIEGQRKTLEFSRPATQEEIDTNTHRIFGILNMLWGDESKIRKYEEAFDYPQKMEEFLPEIELYVDELEKNSKEEMEYNGKNISETIKRLVRIRDYMKLSLLRK